ncbi:hypothetical protein [Atlantibacter hermannii]|uniref:hypothetical protein n=1 Tax=Atlantibacter hermannii TaxID=565 RepID=UPI00193190CA|nr:hypothetical protein [Atlantibacter hermannii]MBL7635961.1 hypothetical protein [Atlantibacter hermannii]MBL7676667.1 hypothetical protein [Atlantibacter hermannii]
MAETLNWDRLAVALENVTFSMRPSLRELPAGTLALGIGDAASPGIALNCKNGGQHRSLSAWLWAMDASERRALSDKARLQPITHIAIEDFSLDSCFAWLLFSLFSHGEIHELDAWVRYIDQWEQGFYLDGDNFGHSAACLHTVFAHARLHAAQTATHTYDADLLRHGFIRCLKLLTAFINHTLEPLQGIQSLPSAEYLAAQAALAYEYQLYQLAIERAVTCQLLVEQADSRRKMLVDALFLSEQHPSGLFKIFARNDRTHSWSKNGFTLLGIYRQQQAGTGNDMVISVDPTSGLSLKSLWQALEAEENRRWQGERPCDNPRPLYSYAGALNAPDQPWWDDAGRYTLLGAPKFLGNTHVPGSKLDWWNDVLPIVWQQGFTDYLQPCLMRVDDADAPVEGQKRVCAWRWNQPDARLQQTDTSSYLTSTPSFEAWLAGCSLPVMPTTPGALPAVDHYEAQWQGDVLIVSHQQGVTLFSRAPDNKELEGLLNVARRIAMLSDEYAQFLGKTREIFKKWPQQLKQHAGTIEDKQWEEEIFALRVNALNVLNSTDILFASAQQNRLSEMLQRQWGLHEQRGNLFAQVDRLDALMRDAIARQNSRRHRIYGSLFSALGMGIAASHVWEPVRDILTTNEYEWQLLLFKHPDTTPQQLAEIAGQSAHFELISLIVFLAFGLLGFILFWFFDIRSQEE